MANALRIPIGEKMKDVIEYEPVKPKRENPFKGLRFRIIVTFGTLAILGWLGANHGCADPAGCVAPTLWFMVFAVSAPIVAVIAFFGFLLTGRPW